MAAANFVVITKTDRGACLMEHPLQQCWSTNSVPRAFFPRVAIGCMLSLKIDRNLSPSWAGGLSVATWYDTAWIGGTASGEYLYRSVSVMELNNYALQVDCCSAWEKVMSLWCHIGVAKRRGCKGCKSPFPRAKIPNVYDLRVLYPAVTRILQTRICHFPD